ncbi:hypothetical protein A5906_05120 [Bradyrhizobium sacchari]|uniref:IstB-like ATP binding protein n=1 Tax=Bradyrhizobium sacchari TaxID=1399419 RepID=A0A560J463_9BRAD|nr:ATP-binding protein [Bradyrhizobium sacchari]OPY96045.1 hypothetical protein A5906_05120 [Bradyrhizobium sacchari]TWB47251.1 IstB-like ATP binding protein [Bradyrhizobium sacchari]TWB66033.1 IstB-like ATP binding protein [Bradyrhizobium sacchari]
MLIHPTVDRLRALGLAAVADILVELQNNPAAAEMPHADWLGLLVDREVTARNNRRRYAPLEQRHRTARGLDRSHFQILATWQWIHEANHLVIVGPNRCRQVLACLCARQQSLPRRLLRPL